MLLNFVWRRMGKFGDTSPIVSERAKIVLSHRVHCLSTVYDRVAKTVAENQILSAKNDIEFCCLR